MSNLIQKHFSVGTEKNKNFTIAPVLPTIDIENRRYLGSKAKLLDWIFASIQQECKGNSFADIFAGTGVVAARAATMYKEIILNDILHSNYVAYQGFFAQEKYDRSKILSLVSDYNSLSQAKLRSTSFSKSFGGKYFTKFTAKVIGHIREDLENRRTELNAKEFNILLTSLLYSADKVANTVGHYDAFFGKTIADKKFVFRLIEPLIKASKVSIYREDANSLAKKISADIVYIDPPYNSRQYSRFYHVLETLAQWDHPELKGVALKRPSENMSDYCRNEAPLAFEDLIKNLNAKYIVVSYNNTYKSKSSSSRNKIELKTIQSILDRKGKTKIFKKQHQFFNAGKTNFDNHQEWLFITRIT